ncbi:hypothetical protein, partial [Stenotrophomonas sp. SrG]|uniref:hypothetical protein n=1 Tax=Stenotrophomonas sp. SrG TaxID=3414430 RepID=UPI003CFBA84B
YLLAGGQPVDAGSITSHADGSATTVNELGDVKQLEIGGAQVRAITKTVDAQGTRSQIFDTNGRLTWKVDAVGSRTTLSYLEPNSGAGSQIVTRTVESIGRIGRTT